MPLKPLVHSVTRKGGRGIPSCVQQQEEKNQKTVNSVCGTVKAAKLEGDPGFLCLIASSVYDTKPVYSLSIISKKVQWIVKERLVYNTQTKRKEIMRFLRLNQIDTYNYGMGCVDISD